MYAYTYIYFFIKKEKTLLVCLKKDIHNSKNIILENPLLQCTTQNKKTNAYRIRYFEYHKK